MTGTQALGLAESETRYLGAHVDRLLAWDVFANVRVQVVRGSLGVFGAPPLGVVSFVAMPLVRGGDAQADAIAVDRVVSAHALRDRLLSSADSFTLPDEVPNAGDLGALPPRDGWQLPIHAIAGDLMPMVDEAVAEFRRRAGSASTLVQQSTADEIWSRMAWAGLPLRVLHTAKLLGFIGRDASRVAAATAGPWKRLTTARGQVFVQATGAQARIGLSVIR